MHARENLARQVRPHAAVAAAVATSLIGLVSFLAGMACLAQVQSQVEAQAPAAVKPQISAEECAVWQRELTFAQSVEKHDANAFALHLHAGAVFNAGTATPARGREEVIKSWAAIVEGKRVILRWQPQFVNIGGDGDIAITRGPFVLEDPRPEAKSRYRVGHYVSIWKKDPKSGVWHVLFDGGGPAPTPVENALAAQNHLAGAPKVCVAQ